MKKNNDEKTYPLADSDLPLHLWAHRGSSRRYPENTLESLMSAAALEEITGVELDVQMTKDGELVVIHDETVDRTTDGTGEVREFTLAELRKLRIPWDWDYESYIPTLEEALQILSPACHSKQILIDIELKNSKIHYEGMEEKVLAMVDKCHLKCSVIYSSLLPESMKRIKELDPTAKTAIVGTDAMQCLKVMEEVHADAIHPRIDGLPTSEEDVRKLQGIPVRIWNADEPLFGQDIPIPEWDFEKYRKLGATDFFTNVPEWYLWG